MEMKMKTRVAPTDLDIMGPRPCFILSRITVKGFLKGVLKRRIKIAPTSAITSAKNG